MTKEIKDKELKVTKETEAATSKAAPKKEKEKKIEVAPALENTPEDEATVSADVSATKPPAKKKATTFGTVEIENLESSRSHNARPKRFNRKDRKYVATIEGEDKYKKAMSEDNQRLAALLQSEKTGTILTAVVVGEQPAEGRDMKLLVCRYGTYKIVIPENLFLELSPEKDAEKDHILSRRTGSTVDFVVKGIIPDKRTAIASRLEAMKIKRQRYWFGTNKTPDGSGMEYHFKEGMRMEARIVATAKGSIRVEVFGVEVKIDVQNLSYQRIPDATKVFNVGDKEVVRIMKIDRNPKTFDVKVEASVKAAQEDPRIRAMDFYVKGGEYEGIITMINTTSDSNLGVFVRLEGIDAACAWIADMPVGIGDMVKVKVTKIDESKLQISGHLRHIIRRAL